MVDLVTALEDIGEQAAELSVAIAVQRQGLVETCRLTLPRDGTGFAVPTAGKPPIGYCRGSGELPQRPRPNPAA